MDISENKSEVARTLWQIEQTCEALRLVTNDPGFSASHEAIRKRYARLGQQEQELARHVGEDLAHELTYSMYNHVMEREEATMPEPVESSNPAGSATPTSEQETRTPGEAEPPEARLSVAGGEARLLIITLPEFRRGYEAGKRAIREEEGLRPFLLDIEVLEALKIFAEEGLFTNADQTPLQWHIGQLLGYIERTALQSGDPVQHTVVQVRDNLVLTVSLIPLKDLAEPCPTRKDEM